MSRFSLLFPSLSVRDACICTRTQIYRCMYIHISLFAGTDFSDRGLTRGKNVARARRALGDDRPPSVLNNGHYVPGHNSMGYVIRPARHRPRRIGTNPMTKEEDLEAEEGINLLCSCRVPGAPTFHKTMNLISIYRLINSIGDSSLRLSSSLPSVDAIINFNSNFCPYSIFERGPSCVRTIYLNSSLLFTRFVLRMLLFHRREDTKTSIIIRQHIILKCCKL